MTRYADPQRCPDCGTAFDGAAASCAHCGLSLFGPVAGELYSTLQRADWLLQQLRATPRTEADPAGVASPRSAADPPRVQWRPPAPAFPGAPVAPAARRSGLSGASVPKILLSLGALCLLVAAITFLAVAWSWLGVGGRTAVLITLTAAAGGLAWWLWRRGLRVAAESLSTVGFGMLTLDVVGAESSGWFGDLSVGGLVIAVGSLVGLVGMLATYVLGWRGRPLWAPQIFSTLGVWAIPFGVLDLTSHTAAVAAVATVGLGLVAGLAHVVSIGRMRELAGAAAVFWWLVLAGVGFHRLSEHSTAAELWADLHAWPTIAAALLLLVPAYLVRRHGWRPAALSGVSAGLVTTAVAFPASDNSVNQSAVAALCAAAVWAVVLLSLAGRWKITPLIPMLGSALVAVPNGLLVGEGMTGSLFDMGPTWSRAADFRLLRANTEGHPALMLAMAAVGLLVIVALVSLRGEPATFARRFAPFGAAAVLAAGIGTLASYAVPVAAVGAAVLVLSALLVGWAFARTDTDGSAALVVALALVITALVAALPSTVLTLVVIAATVLAGAAIGFRSVASTNRPPALSVLAVATAGLAWTAAEVAGVDDPWKAAPVLVLVGALALVLPRLPVEIPAAVSGAVALVASVTAGLDHSETWGLRSLALHLTVAGVLVTATALAHPQRRMLAYPGGLLLAMASWVRLYDLGVTAPEAYTLPSAVALVLLGLHRLRRDPDSTTLTNLTPGLVLATMPTLVQTFTDEAVSLRPLLLGAACLNLVMAGTRLRWTAPLVVGATIGALLVLRELGPYAADLPPWLVIAIAGTALTVVGITWESRQRNLRDAGRYLSRLR